MNISKLATLANLSLSADEAKKLENQFQVTLEFVDHLKEIDTAEIKETSHVTGKTNQFREDEITTGLTQAQALQNAPKTDKDFFVSKIKWE